VNLATAILHAIADRPLLNIQPDVIHILHGGASFGVSDSALSLSSAFVHEAFLLRFIHSNFSEPRPAGIFVFERNVEKKKRASEKTEALGE
jgi:hypothetical protein